MFKIKFSKPILIIEYFAINARGLCFGSCRYGINKCASQKGVENCGECDNYPCEKIKAAFEGTQAYADRCKEICTAEEYMILDKAFFSKKQRLDEVNMQCKKQRNCGLSDRIDIWI